MQRHLAQRCATCEESYRQYTRQVLDAPVMLVFDTFQHALPAGIRSGTLGSRHLLYRVDELRADLGSEASARTERLLLMGQVADAGRPDVAVGPMRLGRRQRRRRAPVARGQRSRRIPM